MPQEGLREMATKHLFGDKKLHKAQSGYIRHDAPPGTTEGPSDVPPGMQGMNMQQLLAALFGGGFGGGGGGGMQLPAGVGGGLGGASGDPSVFQGSGLLQALLGQLGGQAETFAIGVPQVQQQLMGLLGQVFPGMYGITDPAEQRRQMGAPQFYRSGGQTYLQDPTGQFRLVSSPGVFGALGGTNANVQNVGAGFRQGMGDLGAPILATDIPSVMSSFNKPTLGAQQFDLQKQQSRTQRELRGLSGVPGAGQIPGFGI